MGNGGGWRSARFLEDHPELLSGDGDYLDALEDEWYVKNNLHPWRRGLHRARVQND